MSTEYWITCLTCHEEHSWSKTGGSAKSWLLAILSKRQQIIEAWKVLREIGTTYTFELADDCGRRFDADWLLKHEACTLVVRDEYGHQYRCDCASCKATARAAAGSARLLESGTET